MSDKISKSPQIRFAEFTDVWKQVKLKDCFTERSERSAEGELISVTINSGVVKASDLDRKDNSSSDKSNYKVVKVGDIAYNSMRMWQGASGFSPYNGILSPAYTVITPKENSNPKFFAYNFKRHEMISTFQINSQGLTSDTWNLKFPALSSIKVAIPSYEEQTEIARFFEKLDYQLELHRRELQLLKDTKKSLLQKMFPKDGANVPEIRFEGFTDAWKQRELSDLMTFSNGINAPKENYGKGRKMISVMDILAKEPLTYEKIRNSVSVDKKIEEKNKVENGDLVFVRSSEVSEEVGWAKAYLQDEYALYSGFSIRGKRKNNYDAYFIELSLNNVHRKQIESKAGGSTRFNVSQEILNSVIISEPSLDEQAEISGFFTHLDNLITLHQREINSLENLKKSLIQQMFV